MILEVKNLVKRFNEFTAINDISFSVPASPSLGGEEGQILGFLGPNGAGKSTTIYCILGLISPDEGSVNIFGKDVSKDRSKIFKDVNYASADFYLPWNLSVWENLYVYAKLYEVPDAKKRIAELLEIFQMSEFKNTATKNVLKSGRLVKLI